MALSRITKEDISDILLDVIDAGLNPKFWFSIDADMMDRIQMIIEKGKDQPSDEFHSSVHYSTEHLKNYMEDNEWSLVDETIRSESVSYTWKENNINSK